MIADISMREIIIKNIHFKNHDTGGNVWFVSYRSQQRRFFSVRLNEILHSPKLKITDGLHSFT